MNRESIIGWTRMSIKSRLGIIASHETVEYTTNTMFCNTIITSMMIPPKIIHSIEHLT